MIIPDRLKQTYYNMKQRCYNPNAKDYKNYGWRGIIVCKEWLNNSKSFYDWAINNGYTDKLTIDRENNDGNYEPDNCRWVTRKVQNNNKANNKIIEIDGISKTIAQWSEETGVPPNTLSYRIGIGLKTYKDLFAIPSHVEIEINNQTKTLLEWSKTSGLDTATIYRRYTAGWDNNDLLSELIDITKHIEINGEIHTATEWAEISGLTRDIILHRISYGWKNEDLLKPKTKEIKKKILKLMANPTLKMNGVKF